MGKTRNRRSRKFETSSPDRSLDETPIETSNQGNDILTNGNSDVQEISGADNSRPQLN